MLSSVEQKKRTVHLMGTVIDLMIEHDAADRILSEVVRRLKQYEHRFSANDPHSELMAVNQNAGIQSVSVHAELFELIELGRQHSLAPDSHLNIAIGPLVQTWRIGFKDARVPADEEIQQLLKRIDPRNIILNKEKQTVYLSEPGMLIDLGALAKGYIGDRIIDYLNSVGVKTALINLGGNLIGMGPPADHKKDYWKIGIQNPAQERNQYDIALKVVDQSVVTSGIYERSLKQEGQDYHHILDPQTGYPMTTNIASLTICSDQSVDGEIWTTRLFGKPIHEILKTIDRLPGIEGLVITVEGAIHYSNGLKGSLIQHQTIIR